MFVFRSPEQWARGLIGCTPEQAQAGALFIMHNAAPWPVCMDGVDFPMDVYWLSDSRMVLEHAELFPGMGIVWPDVTAQYVLELPMGETPRYRVGDFVEVMDDAPAN